MNFDFGQKGDAEAVDVEGSVLASKDTFPNAEDLEKLEFLGEEEGQPPEAVVQLVDFQDVQLLPQHGLRCLP